MFHTTNEASNSLNIFGAQDIIFVIFVGFIVFLLSKIFKSFFDKYIGNVFFYFIINKY